MSVTRREIGIQCFARPDSGLTRHSAVENRRNDEVMLLDAIPAFCWAL